MTGLSKMTGSFHWTRRRLLGAAAAGLGGFIPRESPAAEAWKGGDVAHLLPTAAEDRILLKASFRRAHSKPPQLAIGQRRIAGVRTDTEGRFYAFDVSGLEPATLYELRLHGDTEPLCDPWPLRTFPSRLSSPEHLRLLIYTCAGGHDAMVRDRQRGFLPVATRRRLLERALSFSPDAVIANGDHVYWDQRTGGRVPEAIDYAGEFDRTLPILGTPNERVLKRAVGPQVADLYGTLLRSVPVFFLQDDHDYFDGDRVREWVIPYPPDAFMLRAGRASQWLYYPEFLPDPDRPPGLPGASAADRFTGLSECFGTLRYGRLAEALLYDCRRYQTLKGRLGTLVPEETEAWIQGRIRDKRVAQLIQVPSIPVGWSAGKWGEWYPDVMIDGELSTSRPKEFWQDGWRRQHDRLLVATSEMRDRLPLFLNGDLHSIAEANIFGTGSHDLSSNPVATVLVGPLGTEGGWPSRGRGIRGTSSLTLRMEESLSCLEENGFAIVDVEPAVVRVRFFKWRPDQGEEAIKSLEPFRSSEFRKTIQA